MAENLYDTVRGELAARKGAWKRIAADLAPSLSYSLISKIGRGEYKSSPSYNRLKLLADYFKGKK